MKNGQRGLRRLIAAIFLTLLPMANLARAEPSPASYRSLPAIPLPDGRWDLLSVDTQHHRVLIARGDSVTVVDLAGGGTKSIGTIVRGHAAVAIEGTELIAVTSGGDDSVRLLNVTSGKQLARIAVGQNPDAAIYDPSSQRLIVMNAKGGTVSVVDPRAARVDKTITVKPGLELGALIGSGLLAINDEDASEIELVDLKFGKVLSPIVLTGCEGPTGIAFDAADGLLISACGNGQAALVDTRSRQLITLLPIGKGPDGALFDRQRRRFLIPCGQSGTVSVFAVDRTRHVKALAPIPTAVGARTATLDPTNGRVYLPAATYAPPTAGSRPNALPNTARLIVLEPTVNR